MKLQRIFSLLFSAAFFALPLCACNGGEREENETGDAAYSVELGGKTHDLLLGDEALASFSLSPVAKKNGAAVEGASFTYTASDPAVATVSEEGLVTAVGGGTSTVNAAYYAGKKTVSAKMTVRVFEEATAEEVNSFDEAYVNLYGRMENGEGVVNIDNVGSGIEVAFFGTELRAKLSVTPSASAPAPYGHVFIDGEAQEFAPFSSGDDVVLAEGLEEGIHTVAIHKSSEIDEGRLSVHAFYSDRFLAVPEKSDLKIEFVGDSITCGYGNLVMGNIGESRSISNSDACLGYAFLTGQALRADFSLISYSGICVKQFMWGGTLNMAELHTYTSLVTKTPYKYDSDMDVVVLNLGTNDGGYIDTHTTYGLNDFPDDYREFLEHLRAVYPDAYIICAYGMMGTNSYVDRGIKMALEELNDSKISYKTFPQNSMGANTHPYRTAHATYAKTLTAYIEELIG